MDGLYLLIGIVLMLTVIYTYRYCRAKDRINRNIILKRYGNVLTRLIAVIASIAWILLFTIYSVNLAPLIVKFSTELINTQEYSVETARVIAFMPEFYAITLIFIMIWFCIKMAKCIPNITLFKFSETENEIRLKNGKK